MLQLVECVPNFSEGRNQDTIRAISDAIESVDRVKLLDVDPGGDTNRTVVTFVGDPEAALEAALVAIATAARLIDMRQHQGAHARQGATDVCPFVPVAGVTMEDCIELARRLGERVGDELGIPVYLYEHAASRPERANLAEVRRGEYEGLAAKLRDPEWKPDFGPAEFNAKSGATAIGAREFLIAYNVNLNTTERRLAHDIALDIREAGRAKRDAEGKIVRNPDGSTVKVPGRLEHCKAVGWYIDEYKIAQVSMNLTNYKVTPPHLAFEEVSTQAAKRGLRVTGSEIVGLVPLEAMRAAGRYYLERQGRSTGAPGAELVRIAAQSMGLSEVAPFDPKQKIIEYAYREPPPLVSMTVRDFADELSSESPAPGGGSVAALCGALGAALASMVANLTIGKKGLEDSWEPLRPVADAAQAAKDFFLDAIDRDTDAFNAVMAAVRGRARSDEEKAAKAKAIEEATREAILVPLSVLERAQETVELAARVAERGNPNSLSDAGVAALAAAAAARGAYYNVLINMEGISDPAWRDRTVSHAEERVHAIEEAAARISSGIASRLIPAGTASGA